MTSLVRFRRASLLTLAFASLAACSDDDEGGTGISNQGSFSLGAPSGAVTTVAGGTGTATIPVSRSGGLTAPVALMARDLPTGVSVSFTPGFVQPGVNQATMIVRVAESVAAGNATFRVVAKVDGRPDSASTTVNLTTTGMPRFTVTFPMDTMQVQRGGSFTRSVTINRMDGFDGAVQLILDAPPAGVTWTSTATTGNTASITVNTTSAAQATTVLSSARVIALGRPDATGLLRFRINAEPGVQIASPATLATLQGNPNSLAVTVNREGGFTGPVTVTLSGLPAGVTAAPVTSAAGTTVDVPLTIAENATAGTSNVTVSVSGTGIETKTATTALTVANTLLQSGVAVTGVADARARGSRLFYRVNVPAGATQLRVTFSGGTGDGDLYLRPGSATAASACSSENAANAETCTITNPAAGVWYVMLEVWDPYAGATLTATITP
jgi:hypothetical protein